MAPTIPTQRPLLTATRLAFAIAVVSCASTLYLALAKAEAAESSASSEQIAVCQGVALVR